MNALLESLSPGQIFLLLIGVLIAIAGFINAVGSAIEKISKFWRALKAPDEELANKQSELEGKVEDLTDKVDTLEKGLDKLKSHHESDMAESREERQLIVYGLLSCLKGLQEQGCDGPVSEAVEKLEKHLNAKAHKR